MMNEGRSFFLRHGLRFYRAVKITLVLSVLVAATPTMAQVTVYTDKNAFTGGSGAQLQLFPSQDLLAFELPFAHVRITAPNASGLTIDGMFGNVFYDTPPLLPTPTNPFPTTGNIAANGEDDYLLTFPEPVNSVGLTFVTNFTANQRITLKDDAGNVLFDDSIDALTSPNSVFFIGFTSTVPIKSLFLDTTDGGIENEAITEIWLPFPIEPPPPVCATVSTDQSAFIAATGASLVPFPSNDLLAFELPFPGVTVTAPSASGLTIDGMQGNVFYDTPPLLATATNPFPTTGNIAANGEDDYLFTFSNPVKAVGLKFVTNYTASQRITLKDEADNVLFDQSIDDLTPPNSVVFIGVNSCTPFKTLFLDNTNGGVENEAILEIWISESGGGNHVPLANAGDDQSAAVGAVVTLDGTLSSDPDGDTLTYQWTLIAKPVGSAATLANADSPNPTFTVDVAKIYKVQLVVSDGQASSAPAIVVISSNARPIAEAGSNQTVAVGATVMLDGSQSYDPEGAALTYRWSFNPKPAGSTATFSDPAAVSPTFIADKPGDYVIELVVNDGVSDSAPDVVTISTINSGPQAVATSNSPVDVGETVSLDGTQSSDADGDNLSHLWSFMSRPAGSTASISNEASPLASFVADRAGSYIVQLRVSDGSLESTTTITIAAFEDPDDIIKRILNTINALPPSAFKNPNMARALTNKLDAVLRHIESGNYAAALNQVENDIIQKTDGCALEGAPDANDFITNCPAQAQIYPDLIELGDMLRVLGGP